MKKVTLSCFLMSLLVLSVRVSAQNDTLRVGSPQEAADWVFTHLNPQQYEGKLINRAVEAYSFTEQQMDGDYNQIHNFSSWISMYGDVLQSFKNQSVEVDLEEKIQQLGTFVQEMNFDTDKQMMPFGLVLYQVNQLADPGNLNVQNNQIIPPRDEESLYEQISIKSAASLELFGDSEFTQGVLKYNQNFILIGSEVSNLSIQIDIGNGFQPFDDRNSEIVYDRQVDSSMAMALLNYQIGSQWFTDSLAFYLVEKGKGTQGSQNRGSDPFDYTGTYDGDGTDYKYGIIYGCGNTEGVRRPIIFVPPYRPNLQPVTLKGYYKQHNVKALFHSLRLKGYDIIILKDKKGNESLQDAGKALLGFIRKINIDKKNNYPNEDWENVVIGFSMGGQVSRYALMLGEKEHMNNGKAHPHTRLYIPFDSPHHGVNIPIGCQAVIYELARTLNPLAMLHRIFLKDEASKDMGMHAIFNSSITNPTGNDYKIYPSPAPEHTQLLNDFNSVLPHAYTITADQRKAFPAFSRNVGVSMGSYVYNYTTDPSEGLVAGQLMFKQNVVTPILKPWPPFVIGTKWTRRELYAAKYNSNAVSFKRNDVRLVAFVVPVIFHRDYHTSYAKEWDNAQGGHKNVFYKGAIIGATSIMRSTTLGIGTRLYDNDVMFLPLVSSLAINKSEWPNNDLYFNPSSEALFAQSPFFTSTYFGYPNVGEPINHFKITPFEAVFADQYTYEHIRYSELNGIPNWNNRLDTLRDFLLNEIEADVVRLQNKKIGENNVITDPSHVYSAWYKGKERVEFGSHITNKTDKGDYVIQDDGNITAYAKESVIMYPGFDAQYGSNFHAYIDADGFCEGSQRLKAPNDGFSLDETTKNEVLESSGVGSMLGIYPNPTQGEVSIETASIQQGVLEVLDMQGKMVYTQNVAKQEKVLLDLSTFRKGVYLIRLYNNEEEKRGKVIIK